MRDADLGTTDEQRTRNLLRVLHGMQGSMAGGRGIC